MSPVKLFLAALTIALMPSISTADTQRELSAELFEAVHLGYMPIVVDLVSRGANVNYINGRRETPMHGAASRGHLHIVKYLRARGAHLNPRTVENWIPLHHAFRFGHEHVANYLLANRAPLYFRTRTGQTVFDIAKSTGNVRMMNLLERYRRR